LGYSSGAIWSQWLIRKAKQTGFFTTPTIKSRRTFNALALSQLVRSNIYNGFDGVTTQYTQATLQDLENILVRLADSRAKPGWSTRRFFYDDKTRPPASRCLGQLSHTSYDGQTMP